MFRRNGGRRSLLPALLALAVSVVVLSCVGGRTSSASSSVPAHEVGSTLLAQGGTLGVVAAAGSNALPPRTNSIVAEIPLVGGASGGAVLDPTNGFVYVPSNYTNLTVINGATDSVEETLVLGNHSAAETPTYVGGSVNQIFVPQRSSNLVDPDNVSVISGATGAILENISTGTYSAPAGAAYDPENGYLYVPDNGRSNVTVINTAKDTVVVTIPVGEDPFTPAYDPTDGDIYVPNEGSGSLSIISTATDTVVATIAGLNLTSVFYGVEELSLNAPVYDAVSKEVYQQDSGASNLTILDGTTVVKNLTIGYGPATPAVDPANGNLYVPTEVTPYNSLAVVNDTSNTVVGHIGVGMDPATPAYDPANGELYVPNMDTSSYRGSVSAINVSTGNVVATIEVGENPLTPVFDPANDEVFVPNFDGLNVTVIDGSPSSSSGGSGGGGGSGSKPAFLGLPGDDGYLLVGGVAVVVVVAATGLFLVKRRRPTGEGNSPSVPPSNAGSPPPPPPPPPR